MKAGWEVKPFEDCIKKVTYSNKIQRKDFLAEGAYPVISQEDDFINGYWNIEADKFKVETPVVIFGDHTKVLKYVDFDFVLGADGVKILPPLDFLEPKFFYYQLQSANLEALGYARHYKLLKALKIVYPSLQEQQRIVAILDQAFEGIAKARANAQQNLQNARALFESHLQSVFTVRGDAELSRSIEPHHPSTSSGRTGWVEFNSALSDLCVLIVDCEHKTAPTQETGIPSIRTPNIGKGELLLEGVYRVSDETYIEWTKRAVPQACDLILAREAPAGNVAIIPENTKLCLGQRTVLIRPKNEIFNSEFLCFYLLQPEMQSKLLAHSRGATVQHVNMKDIRALKIERLPNLDTQNRIVANIKQVKSKAQRLEALYQRKIACLDDLKKSLLQQAFAGEL